MELVVEEMLFNFLNKVTDNLELNIATSEKTGTTELMFSYKGENINPFEKHK